MTRRRRYDGSPRLYGMQEAAEYLGLSRKNLTVKLLRGQVVEPLARLAATPVWSESQLDEQLFIWRDDPKGQWPEERKLLFNLSLRLSKLDYRWNQLVECAIDRADRRRLKAVWEGETAVNRRKGGRSAIASESEVRRALAEAKVLRLVTELRDEDPVFAAIGEELDEAADLRKQIEAIKNARTERADGKGIESHA